MKTTYTNLSEITEVQRKIMTFTNEWVHQKPKKPIPHKEIIRNMVKSGENSATVIRAINGLLRLGYLRRAIGTSNRTFYVQIRTVL